MLRRGAKTSPALCSNYEWQGDLAAKHIANFLDAIRKDEPLAAPIEDAGISTMLCHLGNMAYNAGETLQVDTKSGKVLNSAKAMEHWSREYEPGWEPKL